ncbi:MAG TPA: hypothetical protein VG101_20880 [Puia sp.]|jgi:hypothetical protein|nr:hypothetical protein [Puia sp.]
MVKLQSRSSLVVAAVALVLASGCASNESDPGATVPADSSKSANDIVPPTNPDGFTGALGNVVKFSDTLLQLATTDKPLFIKLTDSLHIFAPTPSSLSTVKSSAYIGVISKKQAGQPDQAVQVLILPEELRGLNEGSFMLPADKDAEGGGRMTNGSASDVGDDGSSRMSNGSVSGADATSLTLQYQGHSRTVNVPAGTPVVEYKLSGKKPGPGDKIFVLVKKGDHDALTGYKIVCF